MGYKFVDFTYEWRASLGGWLAVSRRFNNVRQATQVYQSNTLTPVGSPMDGWQGGMMLRLTSVAVVQLTVWGTVVVWWWRDSVQLDSVMWKVCGTVVIFDGQLLWQHCLCCCVFKKMHGELEEIVVWPWKKDVSVMLQLSLPYSSHFQHLLYIIFGGLQPRHNPTHASTQQCLNMDQNTSGSTNKLVGEHFFSTLHLSFDLYECRLILSNNTY